jgi:hypothetical protein
VLSDLLDPALAGSAESIRPICAPDSAKDARVPPEDEEGIGSPGMARSARRYRGTGREAGGGAEAGGWRRLRAVEAVPVTANVDEESMLPVSAREIVRRLALLGEVASGAIPRASRPTVGLRQTGQQSACVHSHWRMHWR